MTTPVLPAGHRRPLAAAAVLTAAAAVTQAAGTAEIRFVVAGLALAALASVVGQAVESVGERVGPGATGLLQSTLGNLPELFVGIFALRSGLVGVVQAALVGSVLGNALLVLGLALIAGGTRHGVQRFDPELPRLYGTLLLVAVGALLLPTLAHHLDTPAAAHPATLSDVCAGVLLAVYAASTAYTLRAGGEDGSGGGGPLAAPVAELVAASIAAAVVSDWFVNSLVPATRTLGLSQAFTGLVVVAIASNAVENAVSVRFALRAKPAYALATTLSSPLQVALLLTPALVLASNVVGPRPLTLDFPALLVASLAVGTVVVVVVIYDGAYSWIEGVALVGLYAVIATSFWWG